MNDKIIINTISKIHFVLISIFAFIFSILFILFVMLQNGIYIDDISIPNVKAKQLYIKWNEKISIIIKEVDLQDSSKDADSKIQLHEIDMILREIILFDTIFEKVLIEKVHFNNINGSFKYLDGGDGYLNLSSPEFDLKSSLFFQSHLFNIKINSFIDKSKDIKANGNIILNTYSDTELITSLDIEVLDDIKLHLYTKTDLHKLTYRIDLKNNIKDLKPIIDKYAYNWEAKWWVRDAIDMSSLTVDNMYGYIEYDNFKDAYKHLYVNAVVNDLKYTYNKKLDVIDTSHTELEFKDGVLHIRPKNAFTYKMFLNNSHLNIDFTKKDTIVYLHLLFNGMLNKDLLYLLSVYNINLPFTQTEGELQTDLKLDINLNTTDVEAHGSFYTDNSWINYLGLDLNVFNTKVVLHNTDVSVKDMFAKYKDIATSHLDILFNAKKDIGKLNFRIDTISFDSIGLNLKETKAPLHVEYIINPKQDYIDIEESVWSIGKEDIYVQKMKIPFDMKTISAKIPDTKLKSKNIISSKLSGILLFKPLRADIDISIDSLCYLTTSLNQENLNIKFKYDNNISISSAQNISLKTSKDIYTVDNMNIGINNNHIYIKDMNLTNENLFTSNIDLDYDLKDKKGVLLLNYLDVNNNTFDEIFKIEKRTKLDIKTIDKNIIINSKEYGINYILNDYEWKVKIDSIKNIAKESTLLKKYFIDNGKFSLGKKYNESYIDFLFRSKYKYNLLVADDEPIKDYVISGKVHTNKDLIDIDINNIFNVTINDNIDMRSKNIGLNLPEITSFLSDLNTSSENNNSMEVSFNAKDAFVYISKKRHAISDKIEFKYKNKKLDAILKHKKGLANFTYNNGKFILKGKMFEDEFMNNLFALSEIKGGSLGFSIAGKPNKYKGVMYIKDSTIVDYKVLNNVLAFVNTVPALLTFSLPGYNKNGLDVERLYFDFQFENEVYNVSNFSISSKEINIVGKGEASIKNNTINMDLNLKTDLGSSVSKIPVVGYLLLGEDSISTSLTLNGKLDDPTVNTQVVQDIAVAPWNIIKRTLTYPMKLFESDKDKEEKK